MPELGAWLRQQRQARGWSKREMARQLLQAGKSSGDTQMPSVDGMWHNIRRWENGSGGLSERYKLHYCKVLGLSPEEFGADRSMSRREVLTDAALAATAAAGFPALLPSPVLPVAPWAVPVHDAVLNPAGAARRATARRAVPSGPADLDELRRPLQAVTRASLASDFGPLAQVLPDLIGAAEMAAIHVTDEDHPAIQRLACDVYAVAAWTLIKADSPATAWVAAQRAISAAEDAADALRLAAATRCLAEVHMRAGNFDDATRIAFLSTAYLDSLRAADTDTRAVVCIRGAALLTAAAAAARRGDSTAAYAALNAAAAYAADLREDRIERDTMFGPSNVAIHKVVIPVELGHTREALANIPAADAVRMPARLAERRARFLIDVARCHWQAGDDQAAAGALAQAERAAPDETRNHRLTRELVRALLPRSQRASPVRELAARCRLLN